MSLPYLGGALDSGSEPNRLFKSAGRKLPPRLTSTLACSRYALYGPKYAVKLASVAPTEGQPTEQNFVKYHPSATVRVVSKLVYARYKTRKLFLDLYLPVPLGRSRPGAIVVRGGGWLVGDRKRFAHVASALAQRGVAAACIEYRTANKAAFTAAIQDVKAAVRWMRANAAQYGMTPMWSVR